MTISVIIPTLNETTIMATLTQTAALGFDELIVADGGSLDQTPLFRVQDSCARVPSRSTGHRPSGRARQMNEGAKACRASDLFLHADTQLPDDARRVIETTLH